MKLVIILMTTITKNIIIIVRRLGSSVGYILNLYFFLNSHIKTEVFHKYLTIN